MTISTTDHLDALREALLAFEASGGGDEVGRLGVELGRRLAAGGRLLVVGNGGSAAQAEHLAAELVGRFRVERAPYSAIALHVDGAALTALTNDYGPEEMFARQVRAHGRAGDVLLALSTSGASPNVLAAADAALQVGMTVWALTGPGPNPLVERSTAHVAVAAATTATVQEVHQVVVHLLCAAFDEEVGGPAGATATSRVPGGADGRTGRKAAAPLS